MPKSGGSGVKNKSAQRTDKGGSHRKSAKVGEKRDGRKDPSVNPKVYESKTDDRGKGSSSKRKKSKSSGAESDSNNASSSVKRTPSRSSSVGKDKSGSSNKHGSRNRSKETQSAKSKGGHGRESKTSTKSKKSSGEGDRSGSKKSGTNPTAKTDGSSSKRRKKDVKATPAEQTLIVPERSEAESSFFDHESSFEGTSEDFERKGGGSQRSAPKATTSIADDEAMGKTMILPSRTAESNDDANETGASAESAENEKVEEAAADSLADETATEQVRGGSSLSEGESHGEGASDEVAPAGAGDEEEDAGPLEERSGDVEGDKEERLEAEGKHEVDKGETSEENIQEGYGADSGAEAEAGTAAGGAAEEGEGKGIAPGCSEEEVADVDSTPSGGTAVETEGAVACDESDAQVEPTVESGSRDDGAEDAADPCVSLPCTHSVDPLASLRAERQKKSDADAVESLMAQLLPTASSWGPLGADAGGSDSTKPSAPASVIRMRSRTAAPVMVHIRLPERLGGKTVPVTLTENATLDTINQLLWKQVPTMWAEKRDAYLLRDLHSDSLLTVEFKKIIHYECVADRYHRKEPIELVLVDKEAEMEDGVQADVCAPDAAPDSLRDAEVLASELSETQVALHHVQLALREWQRMVAEQLVGLESHEAEQRQTLQETLLRIAQISEGRAHNEDSESSSDDEADELLQGGLFIESRAGLETDEWEEMVDRFAGAAAYAKSSKEKRQLAADGEDLPPVEDTLAPADDAEEDGDVRMVGEETAAPGGEPSTKEPTGPGAAAPLTRVQRLLHEFVDTERSYVKGLGLVVHHYMANLAEEGLLTTLELPAVFGNAPTLLEMHNVLLPDLVAAVASSDPSSVAAAFAKFVPFLKMYTHYVNGFDESTALLEQRTNESEKLRKRLNKLMRAPECGNLDLPSFLIMPVQRLPRYEMLLRDLLKGLREEDEEVGPEGATDERQAALAKIKEVLGKVQEVNVHVNRDKTTADERKELYRLNAATQPKGLNIFDRVDRLLKRHGLVEVLNVRNLADNETPLSELKFLKRSLFLFDDLLVEVRTSGGKFKYVRDYNLRTIRLLESTAEAVSAAKPKKKKKKGKKIKGTDAPPKEELEMGHETGDTAAEVPADEPSQAIRQRTFVLQKGRRTFFLVQASSEQEKGEWIADIRSVMEAMAGMSTSPKLSPREKKGPAEELSGPLPADVADGDAEANTALAAEAASTPVGGEARPDPPDTDAAAAEEAAPASEEAEPGPPQEAEPASPRPLSSNGAKSTGGEIRSGGSEGNDVVGASALGGGGAVSDDDSDPAPSLGDSGKVSAPTGDDEPVKEASGTSSEGPADEGMAPEPSNVLEAPRQDSKTAKEGKKGASSGGVKDAAKAKKRGAGGKVGSGEAAAKDGEKKERKAKKSRSEAELPAGGRTSKTDDRKSKSSHPRKASAKAASKKSLSKENKNGSNEKKASSKVERESASKGEKKEASSGEKKRTKEPPRENKKHTKKEAPKEDKKERTKSPRRRKGE